jgi:hypothetical protein
MKLNILCFSAILVIIISLLIVYRNDRRQFDEFVDVWIPVFSDDISVKVDRVAVEERFRSYTAMNPKSKLRFTFTKDTSEVRTQFILPRLQHCKTNRCFFVGKCPADADPQGQEAEGRSIVLVP